jgi:hypothetical protein
MQVKLGNRLRLLTYGTANNDRNFVELQRCVRVRILLLSICAQLVCNRRAGVDAVCVDHVSYIRKSLPLHSEKS